ncbi:hypothetical protein FRAHR75_120002 [Frankia sp. Hr75.2]|nr:hypothetical protein FRAHR75_120002 [Frankia sp. Hr75.2]
MIWLALRLSLAGGRESAARLAVLAGAVALGVGMLLAPLAGMNAVQAQNLRYGWLNTAIAPDSTQGPGDGLWWLLREDYYHGESIGRIDVASLGPGVAVPPGVPRLPAAGEFYVSPALAELLRTVPSGELGDRFPGREAGVLGPAALPSPDSLIILIGRDPATERLGGQRVNQISTTDPGDCDGCVVGFNPDALTLVLSVVAVALLFPVLMFIGTATRLAAARREQRFAAMRLVGATPRQISVFSAVESTARPALAPSPDSRCSSRAGRNSPRSRSPATASTPPTFRSASPTCWRSRSASRWVPPSRPGWRCAGCRSRCWAFASRSRRPVPRCTATSWELKIPGPRLLQPNAVIAGLTTRRVPLLFTPHSVVPVLPVAM